MKRKKRNRHFMEKVIDQEREENLRSDNIVVARIEKETEVIAEKEVKAMILEKTEDPVKKVREMEVQIQMKMVTAKEKEMISKKEKEIKIKINIREVTGPMETLMFV